MVLLYTMHLLLTHTSSLKKHECKEERKKKIGLKPIRENVYSSVSETARTMEGISDDGFKNLDTASLQYDAGPSSALLKERKIMEVDRATEKLSQRKIKNDGFKREKPYVNNKSLGKSLSNQFGISVDTKTSLKSEMRAPQSRRIKRNVDEDGRKSQLEKLSSDRGKNTTNVTRTSQTRLQLEPKQGFATQMKGNIASRFLKKTGSLPEEKNLVNETECRPEKYLDKEISPKSNSTGQKPINKSDNRKMIDKKSSGNVKPLKINIKSHSLESEKPKKGDDIDKIIDKKQAKKINISSHGARSEKPTTHNNITDGWSKDKFSTRNGIDHSSGDNLNEKNDGKLNNSWHGEESDSVKGNVDNLSKRNHQVEHYSNSEKETKKWEY